MPAVSHRMNVVVGDITKLAVHAIVNAANEAMCGGGGVDGAIHRAAGPALLEECLKIGYCPQGEARVTKGHLLPARFIIHTVGPVWEGGKFGEREVLISCYRSALAIATEHAVESLAFPCIATGVYGYPKDQACDVAVATIEEWLAYQERPGEVIFCCFNNEDADHYRKRLKVN